MDAENGPIVLFSTWFKEAQAAEINDAGAMALATYDPTAKRISNRIVFLRGVDETGVLFFTHRDSPKSADLLQHPNAALTFHWKSLRRQVRMEGFVRSATTQEVNAFFASRTRKAQLDIWASKQSQPLKSREVLVGDRAAFEADDQLECPDHWCGYRLVLDRVEFWASDRDDSHDRFVFEKRGTGWGETLLYP
jgi:pyridoxamine 5'-phosphate oxidase